MDPAITTAVLAERHRCIGIILRVFGQLKAAGADEVILQILDDLATELETPA